MTVLLKCKMCGGDIEQHGDKTHGVCGSCGSSTTLPKSCDGQKASLFNRGNHLRMHGDFVRAAAVFEKIIEQDATDAEAHWCLALCKHWIGYVEDPETGKQQPICYIRIGSDTLLNDVDYSIAIKHSDAYTAKLYTEEAIRIANIQKDVSAALMRGKFYDVFISCRGTAADGSRTRDSYFAQTIYDELMQAGYKVFLKRKTLEDKSCAEYEPLIFMALCSAKAMIAVGTSQENFNMAWVKREWNRFIYITKGIKKYKEMKRVLIPCYSDMTANDLPGELLMFESQDMNNDDFIENIKEKVRRACGERSVPKPQSAIVSTADKLIQESEEFLKNKDYSAARDVLNRVIKEYPKDYRGWQGLILCTTNGLTTPPAESWKWMFARLENVKERTDPTTFAKFENDFVAYTRKIADNDANANNVIAAYLRETADKSNKDEIDGMKAKINSYLEELKQAEAKKKQRINEYEKMVKSITKAIKPKKNMTWDEKAALKAERLEWLLRFLHYLALYTVLISVALLGISGFLFKLEIPSIGGVSAKVFLFRGVAIFVPAFILLLLTFDEVKKNGRIKSQAGIIHRNIKGRISRFNGAIEKKQRHNQELSTLENQINDIDDKIAQAKSECARLSDQNDKLFAQLCENNGIKQ